MPSAQYYQSLIDTNPFLKRFLDLIGWVEGASYNVGFGNRRIDNLAWHPYPQRAFSIVDPVSKRASTTSAAGKYQFQRGTWDNVARKLGLRDFSPRSQDIAAVDLINQRGALSDVLTGNIASAVIKLKPEWQGFVVKPFRSVVDWFYGKAKAPNNFPAPKVSRPPSVNIPRTTNPVNTDFISEKNRYLLAFFILAVIFIFAFS